MKKIFIKFGIGWFILTIFALVGNNGKKIPESIMAGLGICILVFLYFLPSINASTREHRNKDMITLTNLFFGWTIIGWIIALIWSFSAQPTKISSSV